jgi:hypothetical protein
VNVNRPYPHDRSNKRAGGDSAAQPDQPVAAVKGQRDKEVHEVGDVAPCQLSAIEPTNMDVFVNGMAARYATTIAAKAGTQ